MPSLAEPTQGSRLPVLYDVHRFLLCWLLWSDPRVVFTTIWKSKSFPPDLLQLLVDEIFVSLFLKIELCCWPMVVVVWSPIRHETKFANKCQWHHLKKQSDIPKPPDQLIYGSCCLTCEAALFSVLANIRLGYEEVGFLIVALASSGLQTVSIHQRNL